jgi:hypothetical protein
MLTITEDGLMRNAGEGLGAADALCTYMKLAKRNRNRKQTVTTAFPLDKFTTTITNSSTYLLACCKSRAPEKKSPQVEDNSLIGYTELSYKVTETNMWSPDFVGTLYDNLVYTVSDSVIVMAVMSAVLAAVAAILMLAVIVLRRKKTPLSPTTS